MSTIIPTNSGDLAEAEIKAATRPVPKLQPMRIVQVSETPTTSVSTSVTSNPKEKKLVMNKKEYEAAKTTEHLVETKYLHKKFSTVPTFSDLPPLTDEERNARAKNTTNTVVLGDFPESWKTAGFQRVYRAWTQTPISISGVVSSESTFTPDKFTGILMAWTGSMLLVRLKDIEFMIPEANIKCAITIEKN